VITVTGDDVVLPNGHFSSFVIPLAVSGILSGCFSSTKEVDIVPAPAPVFRCRLQLWKPRVRLLSRRRRPNNRRPQPVGTMEPWSRKRRQDLSTVHCRNKLRQLGTTLIHRRQRRQPRLRQVHKPECSEADFLMAVNQWRCS
jgi:hypothetical protein